MKIFITGATGFIGQHLAKRLVEEGHTVHAIYRSFAKTKSLNYDAIKWFKGDILSMESLEAAMKDCDQVYHLAAYAVAWEKNKGDFEKYNIQGTINVIESAINSKIKSMVITSTAGVFGPSLKNCIDEDTHSLLPHFTGYEKSKAESEKMIAEYVKKGIRIVIVNPTRVYGPGILNESNTVTKMIISYLKGSWHFIPGNGLSIGNYAFVTDVVDGHIQAMQKGRSGERYILGGENICYVTFFETINKITGENHFLFKIPVLLLVGMGYLLEALNFLFKIKPPFTPAHVKKFNFNWETNTLKAEKELNYKKTPFTEGIEKTIEWIKSNYQRDKKY